MSPTGSSPPVGARTRDRDGVAAVRVIVQDIAADGGLLAIGDGVVVVDGTRHGIQDVGHQVGRRGPAFIIHHGNADPVEHGFAIGGRAMVLGTVGPIRVIDPATVPVIARDEQLAAIRIDHDRRVGRRAQQSIQRDDLGCRRAIGAGDVEHQMGQPRRRGDGKPAGNAFFRIVFLDAERPGQDIIRSIVIHVGDLDRRPRQVGLIGFTGLIGQVRLAGPGRQRVGADRARAAARQGHGLQGRRARRREIQAQRRDCLGNTRQARDIGAATTAAARQYRRGRVEHRERILARIEQRQHLVGHRFARLHRRRLRFRRPRARLGDFRRDHHIRILAHHHRRRALGLQHDLCVRARHDACVGRYPHARAQGDLSIVGCLQPGLAGNVSDQDGIGRHAHGIPGSGQQRPAPVQIMRPAKSRLGILPMHKPIFYDGRRLCYRLFLLYIKF